MKILFLVFNQTGKGTYHRAFYLAKYLVQMGHEVTLGVTSPKSRMKINIVYEQSVRIIEFPDLLPGSLRSGWDLWNVLTRILFFGKEHFDLIHGFETRPVVIYPALYLSRRKNIPLFLDWADWFGKGGSVEERPNRLIRSLLRPLETYFEEHFRHEACATTVISKTLMQKALDLGVNPTRLVLLHNGSSVDDLEPIDRKLARKLVELDVNIPVIGYVGTIFRQDAELMASSFDYLHTKLPQTRLVVVGYCPFDVAAFAKHAGFIIQTGKVTIEEMKVWLSAADVFWLPLKDSIANRGRFPLKLHDYMAMGRPIVATDVGDISEFFNKHPVGLISKDTPEAIAEATYTLILDPQRSESIGTNARLIAERECGWMNQTEKLIGLYQKHIQ